MLYINSYLFVVRLTSVVIKSRLGTLSAHIVVALIALVVIGGATRVMEAGLACPDWPLCYGSLFPAGRMNIQVFLEWFHRLDAFFVGIAISIQLTLSLFFKSYLPKWLPWFYGLIFFLLLLQGGLGALTVIELLPPLVVMTHLSLALTLVALMSGLTQILLSTDGNKSPFWWQVLTGGSLFAVIAQSLVGSRMATTWAAQRCIAIGSDCKWLDLHKISAVPVVICIFALIITSCFAGGWFRSQWPIFLFVSILLAGQIFLGVLSVQSQLHEPLLRVFHQLFACLLVGSFSALLCRRPSVESLDDFENSQDTALEVCHG